jgi:hypothetical protein
MFTSGQASLIFWGSSYNDTLVNSRGEDLDSSFTFEIGLFQPGFTPTLGNMEQWADHWIIFDMAANGAGWSPNDHEVNTSVTHTDAAGSSSIHAFPTSVFPQDDRLFLWVYNTKVITDTSTEWSLVYDLPTDTTDVYQDWAFPDPADTGGSLDWQFSDLDAPIFGGVNSIQGDGGYTSSPAIFTIQTHVVPEPGAALLIGVAGTILQLRRRRR